MEVQLLLRSYCNVISTCLGGLPDGTICAYCGRTSTRWRNCFANKSYHTLTDEEQTYIVQSKGSCASNFVGGKCKKHVLRPMQRTAPVSVIPLTPVPLVPVPLTVPAPRAESKATVSASAPVPRALESDVPVPVPAPVSNDPAPVLACRVPVTPVTSSRERQVARAINLLSPSKAFTQIRKTKGKKASQKDKKRKRDELKALRDEQEKRGERVTAAQLCEDIETVYNLEEAPPTSITVQRQDTRLIFVELSDWILTKLAGML